jgi:hypothetical protein
MSFSIFTFSKFAKAASERILTKPWERHNLPEDRGGHLGRGWRMSYRVEGGWRRRISFRRVILVAIAALNSLTTPAVSGAACPSL